MTPTSLISIHDVMPETRPGVEALLAALAATPAATVTLLVVPGRAWSSADLAWLHGLVERGHPLAGHGWLHRCPPPASWRHRLHSAVLSRRVAEHLALDADGIADLIRRCHRWFAVHDLPVLPLYVPPAWALGTIPRQRLAELPFRYYETLGGLYDADRDLSITLPLLGFEADQPLQAAALRISNSFNRLLAMLSGRALRVALHPNDPTLRLGNDIGPCLRGLAGASVGYPGF
ncbi:polysaccharide deacetylase family protein [Alloalcanivorax mobilis]|uniref:DUF2334 domain-containing protein n=1 Tax=Alloalcanivorax mobilis TaxID=2019569 RepID=UPI001E302E19|nr:DUF2334 domain-containing protein [Alloalcanivorax mobilis]